MLAWICSTFQVCGMFAVRKLFCDHSVAENFRKIVHKITMIFINLNRSVVLFLYERSPWDGRFDVITRKANIGHGKLTVTTRVKALFFTRMASRAKTETTTRTRYSNMVWVIRMAL